MVAGDRWPCSLDITSAVSGWPRDSRPATPAIASRPLWKEVPSSFLIGEEDRKLPRSLQHFMAKRARAHRTIEIPGASHAIAVPQPEATAQLILEAAQLTVDA